VPRVAQQLAAEGVEPIVVVTDQPEKYHGQTGLPAGVDVFHRKKLDRVQRDLREKPGVSAMIYDQTCAAELHRKRKRGLVPTPNRRVVINELVCEGCGDCNVQSNCLSVMALETEFGRKRRINQSSCNQDFSCLEGFCPSFVTLEGATRNPVKPLASETLPALPEPETASFGTVYNILIAGVGGTGVVTCSGLLGLAAHLEGKTVLQLDQTGLAQRFGAVLSHVRIASDRERVHGMRIPAGQVDLLLGADLIVSAENEPLSMLSADRSAVVVNTHEEMPPSFILDRDFKFPAQRLLHELRSRSRPEQFSTLDATRLASALLGDSIAANVFLLGFAFQRGLLPLSGRALYRALELYGVNVEKNKQTFDWGRFTAVSPNEVEKMAGNSDQSGERAESLSDVIARREQFLVAYQNRAYADRYLSWVERVQAAEDRTAPGRRSLTEAVARNYFKVLAYKDEYEVARLHSQTGFLEGLRRNFGNDFKFKFHLSPPLLAGTDPDTGRPKKLEFGGWLLPVFKLLARGKRLRGTKLDPFSYTHERRMERKLIDDYEALIEVILAGLDSDRLELADELAALPHAVRGFGPIKVAAVKRFYDERARKLEQWNLRRGDRATTRERASAA
jgi:indolepyruvate ferredoxin oxidoreductase